MRWQKHLKDTDIQNFPFVHTFSATYDIDSVFSEDVKDLIETILKGKYGFNRINMIMNQAGYEYLNEVHIFKRLHRDLGSILDKPNIHRVINVFNTVPLFFHINNVGEMVLERYHKVLKEAMFKSTHEDAQITSIVKAMNKLSALFFIGLIVESASLEDWKVRLLKIYHITFNFNDREGCYLRSMVRIVAEERVISLDEDEDVFGRVSEFIKLNFTSD